MGFEPRTSGLKGQVPSETDYIIEHEQCQAELRLLNEEKVQASDDINTNTLAKNQNGLGGLNQELEKTEAEKSPSRARFIQVSNGDGHLCCFGLDCVSSCIWSACFGWSRPL